MPIRHKRILVTGGAGFIGSSFVRYGLQHIPRCEKIVNLDALTYAADLKHLSSIEMDPRYFFVQGNILDEELVEKLCVDHGIECIVHFAAESHVDRSIAGPRLFYETNIGGTLALLEVVRRQPHLHFHHISTDEVYGALSDAGMFSEESPYRPNSPYAASKAASDHFVRAYAHTYGISATISHCTNNYGPCQNKEKLIPRMIAGCIDKKPLPIYGDGANVRDWIFVDDHSEAIWMILEKGKKGEVYDIGGECEQRNIDLVHFLVDLFAEKKQEDPHELRALICFMPDRPGHDFRYAIDSSKIKKEIGWRPRHGLQGGMSKAMDWYLHYFQEGALR